MSAGRRRSDTHSLEIGIGHWPLAGRTGGSNCWTSQLLHRGVICCNAENILLKW